MKKILSLVLALIFVASIASCAQKPDEELIIGEWEGEVDMSEMMMESFGDEEMGDYVDVKDFKIKLIVEFNEDGKFTASIDKKSAEDAFEGFVDDMKKGMRAYYEDMAEDSGSSVDDLFGDMGMTLDSYFDLMFGEEAVDAMIEGLTSEKNEGEYKIEDGKLYMITEDEEFDKDEYTVYKLTSKKLIFEEIHGEEEEDGIVADKMLPITFKRK